MTREEAIEEINKVFEPAFANYIITALTEGVTVSDKALEQESCEDCISRSDMLDAIGHGTTYTSEDLQRIIKVLPPVTPKEKTGKWEYVQYDGNPNIGNWYCSGGADMKDLTHKMAEFFRGEDFYTKGEDARLELTPEELRLISAWLSENARLISKNKLLKEAIGKIKSELKNSYIGECLYDGGIERGINLIDKHLAEVNE